MDKDDSTMAKLMLADLRLDSIPVPGGSEKCARHENGPIPFTSQEAPSIAVSTTCSVVSNDDDNDGSSSSYGGSSSSSKNFLRNDRPARVVHAQGWERTQHLLMERKNIERKLKRALIGCEEERKRLDEMEGDVFSLEERELSAYEHRSTTTGGTSISSTTRSRSGSGSKHSTDNENSRDSLVESCYLPTKYDEGKALPTMISTAQTNNVTGRTRSSAGRSWSVILEDVQRLSHRCAKMQRELDAKDGRIKQLEEKKQSTVRSFRDAREHHKNIQRKYVSMYTKMCAKQGEEISTMNAKFANKEKQIKERDAVTMQLLDANKKLEVALQAMTKVADDALKAKKQLKVDLKRLKSNHLRDTPHRMHEMGRLRPPLPHQSGWKSSRDLMK